MEPALSFNVDEIKQNLIEILPNVSHAIVFSEGYFSSNIIEMIITNVSKTLEFIYFNNSELEVENLKPLQLNYPFKHIQFNNCISSTAIPLSTSLVYLIANSTIINEKDSITIINQTNDQTVQENILEYYGKADLEFEVADREFEGERKVIIKNYNKQILDV
mmetsp:Transcript_982/g.859  ORF Transcript_982/g.859 Transcript_982/m.859 type:complete len:162 (+) Transcript_982:522-1007(+)